MIASSHRAETADGCASDVARLLTHCPCGLCTVGGPIPAHQPSSVAAPEPSGAAFLTLEHNVPPYPGDRLVARRAGHQSPCPQKNGCGACPGWQALSWPGLRARRLMTELWGKAAMPMR
jgi:hypothetical protein